MEQLIQANPGITAVYAENDEMGIGAVNALNGVPGLSDLPLVGHIFAHSTKSAQQTDIVMTLTPFPDLVVFIGFSLTLFTVLSVASLFVFRRKRPGWQRLRALDFAWPLIPALYILVGTCTMVYGVIWQPKASFTAAATVGVGALVYHLLREKGRVRASQDAEIATDIR